MVLSLTVFVLGCFVFLQVMTSVMSQAEDKVRMCYYTNWSQYRQGVGHFTPHRVDPFLCTHILYAFAQVDTANNTLTLKNDNDEQLYNQVLALKERNPGLKVLLTVGGESQGTQAFEEVSSSRERIVEFANNAIGFLRLNGFDGLDVDWEFPTEDTKHLFHTFVQQVGIRFKLDAEHTGGNRDKLQLTVAVSGNPAIVATTYEPGPFMQFVDHVLLMAYDLWGTWSLTLGHHSPLHPVIPLHEEQGRYSVSQLVEAWTSHGAPRDKLVLGMATYGRTGLMSSSSQHSPGDLWARHMGTAGPITRLVGFLSYFEICSSLNSGEWESSYSPTGKVPYAWNPQTLQFLCYDNPQSFEAKAQYIMDEGLAGAMFWTLDFDDFTGTSCNAGTYPLLRKVKAVLTGEPDDDSATTSDPVAHPSTQTPPAVDNNNNNNNNNTGDSNPPEEVVTHPLKQAQQASPSATQTPIPTTTTTTTTTTKTTTTKKDNSDREGSLRLGSAQSNVAPASGWTISFWVVGAFLLYKLLYRCCCGGDGGFFGRALTRREKKM